MHFHLARWKLSSGFGRPEIPMWTPPQDGALASLDLRSHDECAAAGGTGGWGIFAYPAPISGVDVTVLSDDPQGLIAGARRTALEAALATTLATPRLAGILAELFLAPANIDVTGVTKRKPLMPTNRRRLELYLGGMLQEDETGPGGPAWAVVRAQYREDFRRIRIAVAAGEASPLTARKVLGYWLRKHGLSDASEFQRPGDPVIEPLEPETTINDTFNRADNDALGTSSDGDWSWAEQVVDIDIVSNAAKSMTFQGSTVPTCRAEKDLSSADHYSQAAVTQGDTVSGPGLTTRHSTSALTSYVFANDYANSRWEFLKRIADAYTTLGTGNSGYAHPSGETRYGESNGSSHTQKAGGVTKIGPVTDTAITTGLRTGISAYSNNHIFDNFTAADLAAAAALRRNPVNVSTAVHRAANW